MQVKRCVIGLLLVAAGLLCAVVSARGAEPEIRSETAGVMNLETGKLLYGKNLKGTVYPASLVKIMTAVLSIEYLQQRGGEDFEITVTEDMIRNVQGNHIRLQAGETVGFFDLLHALIVGSANDAAYVLAYTVAGSPENFVRQMNAKAAELGALDTSYANPTGYHSAYMTTTCEDMLSICAYAYKNNTFMQIASLPSYVIPPTNLSAKRTLTSQNLLLNRTHWENYYIPGVMGMNAGSTVEGGYCVATVLEKKGLNSLVVILGGKLIDKRNTSFLDAETLLQYSHEQFQNTTVLKKNSTVCEIPVKLAGNVDHTILVAASDITSLLPIDADLHEDLTTEYEIISDVLYAPVSADRSYGTLKAYYQGEHIGSAEIVAQTNIERSSFLFLLYQARLFLGRKEVKLTLFSLAVLFLLFLTASVIISLRMAKKRMKTEQKKRKAGKTKEKDDSKRRKN